MDDLIPVVNYTVRVSLATRDGDGEPIDDDVLQKRAETLRTELDETGFAGFLEAAAKAQVEERFVSLRPVVEAEAG